MQHVHVGWTQMIQKSVRKSILADTHPIIFLLLPTFSLCATEHCSASKDVKFGVCSPWGWREVEPKYPYRAMYAGYFQD